MITFQRGFFLNIIYLEVVFDLLARNLGGVSKKTIKVCHVLCKTAK